MKFNRRYFKLRKKWNWEKAGLFSTIFLTICLVIANGVLAFISWRTSDLTKDLVEEQKRLNRPAIDVIFTKNNQGEILDYVSKKINDEPAVYKVNMKYKVKLKNSGNILAKDVAFKMGLLMDKENQFVDNTFAQGVETIGLDYESGIYSVMPNQELETYLEIYFLTPDPDKLLNYLNNEEKFILIMRIDYYNDLKSELYNNCPTYLLDKEKIPILQSLLVERDCEERSNKIKSDLKSCLIDTGEISNNK